MILDAGGRDPPVGGAARARRRGLPRAARLPARALAVLPREARRGSVGRAAGGLAEIARAAADREDGAEGDGTAENPFGAHLCVERLRDRPHLLDERHDRHAELHPAHRGRPRQLGHRLGAKLRGLGRRARAAHRLDLQRRAVRRGRRARRRSTRIGLCHVPVGTGQHRAPGAARSTACGPRRSC